MLIVRNIFTAKPGCASKLAGVFKKAMADKPNVRILTDCIADFNTVVMETEVANLSEYEQIMADYQAGRAAMDPETAAEMKNYGELWQTGRREVLQVVK